MSDIGNAKELEKRKAELLQQASRRAVSIRLLCQSREGRDFLWWILEQGSPYSSAMRRDEQGRGDPMSTAYAAGWHDLGALIMQEVMTVDPTGYVMMLTENRNVAELKKVMNERSSQD